MEYEKNHLLKKLETRDSKKFKEVKFSDRFNAHPLFEVKEGEIEEWEVLTF